MQTMATPNSRKPSAIDGVIRPCLDHRAINRPIALQRSGDCSWCIRQAHLYPSRTHVRVPSTDRSGIVLHDRFSDRLSGAPYWLSDSRGSAARFRPGSTDTAIWLSVSSTVSITSAGSLPALARVQKTTPPPSNLSACAALALQSKLGQIALWSWLHGHTGMLNLTLRLPPCWPSAPCLGSV